MKIDGKSVTPINSLRSVDKTNPAEKTQKSADKGDSIQLKNASNFALNNSGIDQAIRKSNDNVTHLQTRQKSIADTVDDIDAYKRAIDQADEKREALAEATQRLAETLKHPPFANTETAEKLSSLVKSENPVGHDVVDDVKNSLENELKLVASELDATVAKVDNNRTEADAIISDIESKIKENPQALSHAYGNVEASTALGLLGSDA